MKWVTRERPKIDRLACPWLIKRFIDADAEVYYVPASQVSAVAASEGATPFDVPGVELTHSGPFFPDDQELLEAALPVYDALYTWCQSLAGERHGWNPDAILEQRQP